MTKSTMEGPFKPRQIQDPGDANLTPPILPHLRDQTEAEYNEDDKLQILADDLAMHLIQPRLSREIFAAVDSCESANAMWERLRRLCHGTEIGK